MTTEEMLIEIVSYKYKAYGFPYVFLDYCFNRKVWSITWRNPADFNNSSNEDGKTPFLACKNALDFIKSNPSIFSRYPEAGI